MTPGNAGLVVVAVVVWFNVLQLPPARWRRVVAPAGVLLAAGIGAAWLFAGADATRGLVAAVPWTAGAFTTAGLVVAVARLRPRLGARLSDHRIQAMSRPEFWRHVLVKIPVLVALPEEIIFRGVVWAVLADPGGDVVAAAVGSSLAFGLSHTVGARAQARREGRAPAAWIVTTILTTTMAGLALGAIRGATGGVWASAGVHAAINATLAWGARHVPRDM